MPMPLKVALIYPPTCDPTAPYLAVPMLTGFLRAAGVDVLPIDANTEAYDFLLRPAPLAAARDRIEDRIAELDRRPALDHAAQLEYGALWRARGDAHAVPDGIDDATAILRDGERFFDAELYAGAVDTIDAALRVLSAAHAPLAFDFTAYRTPFALTTPDEIARDAAPERDPYDGYIQARLVPRLRAAGVGMIGLSICFPGQLQPAFAFALKLKAALPGVHLTVGGPAITQLLIRLRGVDLQRALGPFDTAVVFEGEHTLLALCRALEAGGARAALAAIPNLVHRDPLLGAKFLPGHASEDMRALPAPDFDGLALDRYLAPSLVLPYDPTRGCYWGKCTFCHYGLAEVGTASYRERGIDAAVEHLGALARRHGTRYFYFSQDSVAPKTLVKLAAALADAALDLRWATDLKPEKYLTAERAAILRRGGAVACALGVESANPRVLGLIDKGAPIDVVAGVMGHLAAAGIAPEAMCFTGFPTETGAEAMDTLRFLDTQRAHVAAFIVGEFDLTHGALVAQDPQRFGVRETWQVDGDQLGTALFYEEAVPAKRPGDRARLDRALGRLSSGWLLRRYPWAGSLSTAHTVLYYDRFGPDVMQRLAGQVQGGVLGGDSDGAARTFAARFDLGDTAAAEERDAAIWHRLTRVERHVSRAAYEALAAEQPAAQPRPARYQVSAGAPPAALGRAPRTTRRGRRPSAAPNALRR
ncbi:MAG TPA: radical SAM protein [Polyangia bacterium]|nr:radical SAM protein [Polyangia bacterium]